MRAAKETQDEEADEAHSTLMQKPSPAAQPSVATANAYIKWVSLAFLVLQNSASFVVTQYSRIGVGHRRQYIPSVVCLVVESIKLLVCLALQLREVSGSLSSLTAMLHHHLWHDRMVTLQLAVPAVCYALQNNLMFVAVYNLSAPAAQVLSQLKTLSTAVFTVLLLKRTFRPPQWLSFVLLMIGVALVQWQDAISMRLRRDASPALGVAAAVTAATTSGFAGVYLERIFTSGSTSLWMRNVQLALFSIPLQCLAVSADRAAIMRFGLLQGFRASTWLVVFIQVCGALIIALVIKFAGNVLKTFATVLALLVTCVWSTFLFDFHPTALFGAGVSMTAASIWLYARPDDFTDVPKRAMALLCRPSS